MNKPIDVTQPVIDPAFRFTSEHLGQLRKNGYHFFDRFLTPVGLAHCRDRLGAMLEQRHPDVPTGEMISTHHTERWVWDLATSPQVLDMVEAQIGPDIVLWSTHLLCKPAWTGKAVPWHQDAPYWNIRGQHAASVWIPLDDLTQERGTMSVLPGWHDRGVLPIVDHADALFTDEIRADALPPDVEQLKVTYELQAGQMAIHDVMLPHVSSPNRSDQMRRVMIFRYTAAGGEFGPRTYRHYRTAEPFERTYFLVRGEDVAGQHLPRSPY